MRKAGFLQRDRDTTKDIMSFNTQVIRIIFIGPCIALIPFVIPWVEDTAKFISTHIYIFPKV